ncbi:hypothetical protein VPH35_030116 [Triticum aestivum]
MSTTAGSTRSSSSSQWSDLPDDLLRMVRLRLASLRDRVRIAAVCKGWRAAASRLRLPARPQLLVYPLHGRFIGKKLLCGPDDCFVVRVPDKVEDKRPTCLRKIIFSEAPTSSSCILAAIDYTGSDVLLCKVGGRESGWTAKYMQGRTVSDITFCNGQLYGLTARDEQLVKFEIDVKEDGTPVITSTHLLAIQRRHGPKYGDDPLIFELHGKPSMALRTWWWPNPDPFFKIFMLVETDNVKPYKYKWAEVVNFDEHALFLGSNWSKAVHVPVGQHHETICPTNELPDDVVYSMTMYYSEHMYCRKDQSVDDGVERIGYHLTGSINSGMWLYPSNL